MLLAGRSNNAVRNRCCFQKYSLLVKNTEASKKIYRSFYKEHILPVLLKNQIDVHPDTFRFKYTLQFESSLDEVWSLWQKSKENITRIHGSVDQRGQQPQPLEVGLQAILHELFALLYTKSLYLRTITTNQDNNTNENRIDVFSREIVSIYKLLASLELVLTPRLNTITLFTIINGMTPKYLIQVLLASSTESEEDVKVEIDNLNFYDSFFKEHQKYLSSTLWTFPVRSYIFKRLSNSSAFTSISTSSWIENEISIFYQFIILKERHDFLLLKGNFISLEEKAYLDSVMKKIPLHKGSNLCSFGLLCRLPRHEYLIYGELLVKHAPHLIIPFYERYCTLFKCPQDLPLPFSNHLNFSVATPTEELLLRDKDHNNKYLSSQFSKILADIRSHYLAKIYPQESPTRFFLYTIPQLLSSTSKETSAVDVIFQFLGKYDNPFSRRFFILTLRKYFISMLELFDFESTFIPYVAALFSKEQTLDSQDSHYDTVRTKMYYYIEISQRLQVYSIGHKPWLSYWHAIAEHSSKDGSDNIFQNFLPLASDSFSLEEHLLHDIASSNIEILTSTSKLINGELGRKAQWSSIYAHLLCFPSNFDISKYSFFDKNKTHHPIIPLSSFKSFPELLRQVLQSQHGNTLRCDQNYYYLLLPYFVTSLQPHASRFIQSLEKILIEPCWPHLFSMWRDQFFFLFIPRDSSSFPSLISHNLDYFKDKHLEEFVNISFYCSFQEAFKNAFQRSFPEAHHIINLFLYVRQLEYDLNNGEEKKSLGKLDIPSILVDYSRRDNGSSPFRSPSILSWQQISSREFEMKLCYFSLISFIYKLLKISSSPLLPHYVKLVATYFLHCNSGGSNIFNLSNVKKLCTLNRNLFKDIVVLYSKYRITSTMLPRLFYRHVALHAPDILEDLEGNWFSLTQ